MRLAQALEVYDLVGQWSDAHRDACKVIAALRRSIIAANPDKGWPSPYDGASWKEYEEKWMEA